MFNILQMQSIPNNLGGSPNIDDANCQLVEVINSKGSASLILVCEHASSYIPVSFDNLGLNEQVLNSHLASDPGAKELALSLSKKFDAPLVCSKVSRLLYDCNRSPDSSTAIPEKVGTIDIPGNHGMNEKQIQDRIKNIYIPFNTTLSNIISNKTSIAQKPVLVTIHSFTPNYFGHRRDTDIGLLHDSDSILVDAMLRLSADYTDLNVERNKPYGPEDDVMHTLKIHGIPNSLLHMMIEIKNDLLKSSDEVQSMSEILFKLINHSLINLEAT